MNPIVRNILAPIIGVLLGGLANIALIILGPSVIALPEGINPMDPENLKANFHLLETRHFIFPFLAHAVGTLVGAFIAAKIAATHKMIFGISIGVFFLMGGIMSIMDLGGPTWFIILDVVVAYIPMGYLGAKLASK